MTSNKLSDAMQNAEEMWQDPAMAERYANAENATRPYAKIMVEKSGLAHVDKEVRVLDLATGTGAAIQELYDAVPKEQWGHLKVLGADVSAPMLEYLKVRGEKAGWSTMETQIMDGNNLDLPDNSYTHIFVAFAIFVMPNVLPTLFKALKPGGFITISSWACLPWLELVQKSISQMRNPPYIPNSTDFEGKLFSGMDWNLAPFIAEQLGQSGFEKVDTVQTKYPARIGTPKVCLESLQLPLSMLKGWWEEGKQDELFEEVNGTFYKELVNFAGGEEVEVVLEFEGIVAWGYKPE